MPCILVRMMRLMDAEIRSDFVWWLDRSPVALTPSYEVQQSVRYADGDYDAKFDRIIILREGEYCSCRRRILSCEGCDGQGLYNQRWGSTGGGSCKFLVRFHSSCSFSSDKRRAGVESTTEIVAVNLNGDPSTGVPLSLFVAVFVTFLWHSSFFGQYWTFMIVCKILVIFRRLPLVDFHQ